MTARRRAALLLVAASCTLLVPQQARAQTTSAPAITIELIAQSTFVASDEDFRIQLRVTGADPNDRIRVNVHPRVRSRDDLRRILDTGRPPRTILSMYPDVEDAVIDPVTQIVTITVPGTSPARQPGVYPLSVTVGTGNRAAEPLITALTRVGSLDPEGGPLNVAFVLPLGTAPTLQPDLSRKISVAERDRLRSLGATFTERHESFVLTLAPNPETLDALDDGGPAERAVLQTLRQAARGRTVLETTFVPLDVEAWRSNGLGLPLLEQYRKGISTIDRTLASAQSRRVADIALIGPSETPATLELRRNALDTSRLVVGEGHLQPLDASLFPSTLQQSFVLNDSTGTPMRATTADGRLAFLAGALSEPSLVRQHTWIAHLFLADLAAGYFEHPAVTRGAVVVLPDDWAMTPAIDALLLPVLETLPFIDLVPLDELFTSIDRASPRGAGSTETPASGPLRRTLRPEPAMDLDDYPTLLSRASVHLRGFESIVGPESPRSSELRDLIAVSADRRHGPTGQRAYLLATEAAMDEHLRSPDGRPGIVGPQAQRVTLTSRRATIPIDIENRLEFDATVRVEVRSDKLDFPRGDVFTTTLKPGLNSIEVDVRARTSGDSPLEILIGAPERNTPLGEIATSTFTIRSTALSGVGLALSALALLVLVVWWGRHIHRVRRSSGAVSPGENPMPGVPDTTINESLTRSEP